MTRTRNPIRGTIQMTSVVWPGSCSGEAAIRASLGSLDRALGRSLNAPTDGAVAQLGERSNRTAEVTGSIPVGSTIHVLLGAKCGGQRLHSAGDLANALGA